MGENENHHIYGSLDGMTFSASPKYTVHYGLYFTLWDRLLGTQDAGYGQKMENSEHGKPNVL
jgi:sterol desaturase/sphingolipid hydroxylase (fatty acid hydroxylase superfamily)